MKRLLTLLLNSLLENERFSPRLLTVLACVALTGYLELKLFDSKVSETIAFVLFQVILANIGLIVTLLGLGKITDTIQKIKVPSKADCAPTDPPA
ncbi:hypothetical protein [Hymenobacter sp. GOD-10R]|uniref:hypothetical protein n=1 Tax=Hymenobacter sp. GOD-10R TaxID=3093922 RepID=UPI002D78F8EB|nr:hypothetical protein [Hymenobacter sp. GOD-10R]WRQ26662.1 hypothetical protein SD425_16440 [Hymenobacter sp. GOD-10R]